MCFNELSDGLLQFGNTFESTATQAFLGELAEEAFNDIEPGTAGRREMHMEPGVPFQPILHLFMFVRGIVVYDHVDIQAGRRLLVNLVEELDPFLMAVFVHACRDHLPRDHFNGRKERGRSVSLVVVRHRCTAPLLDRQFRLRSVECLNRCLLIGAHHQCVLGRIQVQAHHITQLLLKTRVIAYLEGLHQVRFEAIGAQHTEDQALVCPDRLQSPVYSSVWRSRVSLPVPF